MMNQMRTFDEVLVDYCIDNRYQLILKIRTFNGSINDYYRLSYTQIDSSDENIVYQKTKVDSLNTLISACISGKRKFPEKLLNVIDNITKPSNDGNKLSDVLKQYNFIQQKPFRNSISRSTLNAKNIVKGDQNIANRELGFGRTNYQFVFKNPVTSYIDAPTCLKFIKRVDDFLDNKLFQLFFQYKETYIKDESTLNTGHFNDREAVDICNLYLAMNYWKLERPAISIIYSCKLPYSLSYYCKKFSIPSLKVLLTPEENEIHGKLLKERGCSVFVNTTFKANNELSPDEILKMTENSEGFYPYDPVFFKESKMLYKNMLYDELLSINADYLFIPWHTGVINKAIKERHQELLKKPEECSVRGIDINRLRKLKIYSCHKKDAKIVKDDFTISVSEKSLENARFIYNEFGIRASEISAYALAGYLQKLSENASDYSFINRFVILNLGESSVLNDARRELEEKNLKQTVVKSNNDKHIVNENV